MGDPLIALASLPPRWGEPWLIGPGAETFWPQLAEFQELFQASTPADILLAEPDPVRFLAAFLAAWQQPCRVWLANPQWGWREWAQVAVQCRPDVMVGRTLPGVGDPRAGTRYTASLPSAESPPIATQILIPTGGSSGNIRFAVHTWDTLAASVVGFQQHFQCARVQAYCVLPLFHVSGLQQAMRCWLSGGQLVLQPFRELWQTGAIAPAHGFLSLVPTQLQRLLSSDREVLPWLRQFTAILLGGAPPWPSLLQTAREWRLPLAPTYGMTETAAQVATLLPEEFWAGQTGSGRPLPHATLTIGDEAGRRLPPGQTGHIHVAAASLAHGYWQQPLTQPFSTGDLGYLDAAGYLHVVGRKTAMIMTGGEKVLPAEVEAAMLATGLVQDACVLGIPDADWGERVVAVVVPAAGEAVGDRLQQALKPVLSPYKIPKQWVSCPALPRNDQGKLNRAELRRWVLAQRPLPVAATESTRGAGDGAAG